MNDIKQHLRDKLYPHLGYFNHICKFIDNGEIKTIEEVDFIVSKLDNKVLIKSLPKAISGYKKYYFLVFDIINTEETNNILKFLKDNIPTCSKNFFISSVTSSDENLRHLKTIYKNEKKMEVFLRWSSRIKSVEYASTYMRDIVQEENSVNLIHGLKGLSYINGFDVLEMKNHQEIRDIIPASWCIKNEQTFQNYLVSYNMYMFVRNGEIYGVNIAKSGLYNAGEVNVLNKNNSSISVIDPVYKDITNIIHEVKNKDKKSSHQSYEDKSRRGDVVKIDEVTGEIKLNKTSLEEKIKIGINKFIKATDISKLRNKKYSY